ncbi:ABC transporter substrate-binding protein [Oceanobacter sp. 5_MG-2023]|uniref:ABC transporter substrate-binding protein n=1 Tax=Oceanobacter sp. 5_MG-2023 TaxID=3062645 RepID=UPI0026E1DC1E|nr:ABC transporter substrate-binding protein [Oceanobacter sp. 5_MG-2023]MDO6680815.1 ABC transporter substrate-binding protein [Oceanobacter sp. 5_MG-2023]
MYRCFVLTALALSALTAQAADSIKLGLNYPSTGPYKEQGIAQARGALLAVEEINAAGGVLGRPLELITANTASKPDKAVENVKRLSSQGVSMLFGGSSSAVAIAAGKEAARQGLIYFGTLTYANETTDEEGHRYMFRETYNAWMAAKALAFYLNQSLAGKKVFYLTADYSWGHSTEGSLRTFTNTQDKNKYPGVLVPFPRPKQADIESALEAAERANADVLMLVQFGDDMASTLKAAYRMGLKDKMTIVVPNLTLGMAISAGAGILEDVIGAVPWTWQVPYLYGFEKGQQFVERFADRFQKYPSSSAASAYNIVYEFKAAVERTGSLSSSRLISALENHTYTGVKDPQTWRDFDHQSVQSVYVVKGKHRATVLADKFNEDYFEVLLSIPGKTAAKTYEEWSATRQAAGKSLTLK